VKFAVVWDVTVKVAVSWDMAAQSLGFWSRRNAGNYLPIYPASYSGRQHS
jgi:hypothetical protein